MLEAGVISKVDQPTDWCAPMVIAAKSNGNVRICVDLSRLNEYVKRENYPLPAVDTTLGKLGGSRVFTKLDANWLLANQTSGGVKITDHLHHPLGTILVQRVAVWHQLRLRKVPKEHDSNP